MVQDLINEAAYLAHGYCLLWQPWLVALHAGSDLLIAVAYFAIPIAIVMFLRQRPSLEMRNLAILFAVFIVLCGLTHLLGLITLWWPIYELNGVVKLVTAAVSVLTAVVIFPLIPKAVAIPSPYEMQQVNAQLTREIESHERTLSELRTIRDNLERLVEERTRELSQAIEQSGLLARELAHRSKNLLAVVVSMARQTSRSCTTVDEFHAKFLPRLQALGAANDELVRNNWRGGDLERLVRVQLEPFIERQRVSIDGPQLFLSAEAVQNIGLAIHELATNAAKHGTLSSGSGRIRISWERSGDEPDAVFRMTWLEGPASPTAELTGSGFGHVVLTQVVPLALTGKAELTKLPTGLRWTLEAPASAVLGDNQSG